MELQPELAKHELRLSTPLLPRANKSVVASLLERQPTIVPKYQWTLPEPLRCLEVVWGNGYKFMTGEAGEQVVNSLEEQWKLGLAQMVAMGIFTKCAVKLSPWPGPTEISVEGTIPAYNSPIPDNFRLYTVAYPDWQACADSYYKIWDSEIGYIAHRQFNVFGEDLSFAFLKVLVDPTKTLNDIEEITKKAEVQKTTEEMRISYQILLVGNSRRDIEYQDKVLNQILADTKGWKVAAMSDPDMEKWVYLYLVRLGHKNLNHAYTGGAGHSLLQMATPDTMAKQISIQREMLAKYQEKGLLVKTGGDTMMGCVGPMGRGTYAVQEQFHFYDPHDEKTIRTALEFQRAARDALREKGFIAGTVEDLAAFKPTKAESEAVMMASKQRVVHHMQWKIRQALDPNETGAPGYTQLEKLPPERQS